MIEQAEADLRRQDRGEEFDDLLAALDPDIKRICDWVEAEMPGVTDEIINAWVASFSEDFADRQLREIEQATGQRIVVESAE